MSQRKLSVASNDSAVDLPGSAIKLKRDNERRQHKLRQASIFSLDFVYFCLFQTTTYVILFLPRLIAAFVNTFIYGANPTEKDVINYIINGTLAIFVKNSTEKQGKYELKVQKCLLSPHSNRGRNLKSFSIVFDLKEIYAFYLNGILETDPQIMMSALTTYTDGAQHTKAHAVSETIMTYIEQNNITQLFPSLYITRSLHKYLMSSIFSPISTSFFPSVALFRKNFDVPSLEEESLNWSDFTHSGMYVLGEVAPLCDFLGKARRICIKHTRGILPMDQAEYFFLHTVFHALDHFNSLKHRKYLNYSSNLDNQGLWECFIEKNFIYTFVGPTLNPYYTNLIKDQPIGSLYYNIYIELEELNKELADQVTASIMY
jgi:hypothetical protein